MADLEAGCSTCAICLDTISPDAEAFLDVCFHQFHYKCIKEWTYQQRRHPPAEGPLLTCPLCKQGYYSIIYDCHDSAFSREQVAPPPRGARAAVPAATFASLTSNHRRRRSVYFRPHDHCERAALAAATLGRRLVSRPDVQRWVQRELQALMWQDDVSLVAQHVLGTLRNAVTQAGGSMSTAAGSQQRFGPTRVAAPAAAAVARQRPGMGPVLLKRNAAVLSGGSIGGASGATGGLAGNENVASAIAAAAAPYVFEHAERFSWELVAFVVSGQSLAAYDREHTAQQAGRGIAAGAANDATLAGSDSPAAGAAAGAGGQGSASGGAGAEPSCSGMGSEGNSSSRCHESPADGGLYRSDSEGYLEVLLAQGRPRQRLADTAEASSGNQLVAAVGIGPDDEDAAAGLSQAGGAAAGPAQTGTGRAAGQPLNAGDGGRVAGGPDGESAVELEGYRSRALQAL